MYKINEEMLGQDATRENAEQMVNILTRQGFKVEYGNAGPVEQDSTPELDCAWDQALRVVAELGDGSGFARSKHQ